jgi:hypothetical protein
MRLFFCDPGLISDLGHHAESCRAIVGEARRRGIATHIFAAANVDRKLQAEFGAQPHFRVSPYSKSDGDPICGWLSGFQISVNTTVEDFRRLNAELRADDVVYVNSGQAAQLLALILWIASSPLPTRAAIEFGVDPWIDLRTTPSGVQGEVRDPRIDANAILYRFASKHLNPSILSRLRMATFDPASSAAYQGLMESPVAVLPVPRGRNVRPRTRIAGAPITVAVLGHQRGEKGYRLVPEIFAALCRRFPREKLRLLAHNAEPAFMPHEQEAMRRLAANDSRCLLDERVADPAIWSELLACSDLILCPYDPKRYALSYSSLASEAAADGIPQIVPANTTLARVVAEFGAGTTFAQWDAASISDAVGEAIERFEALKVQAEAGAEKWARHHGPAHCVTALLQLLTSAP